MYLLPSYEWLHMKLSVVQNYATVFCYNCESILKMKLNLSSQKVIDKIKVVLQTSSNSINSIRSYLCSIHRLEDIKSYTWRYSTLCIVISMTASALKSFQPDIHVGKVKLTNSFVIHLRQNALFYKYGKDNICMIVSFHNINCESNLCFIFSIRARHLLRPYYIGELYLVLNQMLLGYLIKQNKF